MAETDLWFGTLTATVRVEDLPASRQVVAIERQASGDWRVCGQAVSNAEGIATLPITGLPTSRIYAIAIDEWGKPFAPGMTVAYGDVIRPTQFLGWMYQVTSPGALPGEEPEWWNSMAGVPQPVGTAMMQAVRHYQPIAHGPVSDIVWVEQEFDPYWENVVALLPFDDLVEPWKDLTGAAWSGQTGSAYIVPNGGPFDNPYMSFNGDTFLRLFGTSLAEGEPITIESYFRKATDNRGTGTQLILGLYESNTRRMSYYWSDAGDAGDVFRVYQRPSVPDNSSARVILERGFIDGNWEHVAYVRDLGGHRLYIGGILAAHSDQPLNGIAGAIHMGSLQAGTETLYGDLSNVRVTRGIARYASNFTPPRVPFSSIAPPKA